MDLKTFLEEQGIKSELRHHGVKGMKWGTTNAPVAKGISTANSDATGGGDDGTADGRSTDPATWFNKTHGVVTDRPNIVNYTTKGFINQIIEHWGDKKVKMNGKVRIQPGILSFLLHKVGLNQPKKK